MKALLIFLGVIFIISISAVLFYKSESCKAERGVLIASKQLNLYYDYEDAYYNRSLIKGTIQADKEYEIVGVISTKEFAAFAYLIHDDEFGYGVIENEVKHVTVKSTVGRSKLCSLLSLIMVLVQ